MEAKVEPWPPEGTRVRIVGTLEDGKTGRIDNSRRPVHATYQWVRLENRHEVEYWPVERHEIEVIDAVPKD